MDPRGLEGWLANQLMLRKLGLFPIRGDVSVLRLAWIEERPITTIEATDAPPAPARAPPPPPPVLASLPAIPDLPDDISAQAQTLMDAADSGVPFCEECAKAAAARANA